MDRVKEVHDKLEAKKSQPKIDKGASKRFIRNALWQAAQNKGNQGMYQNLDKHSLINEVLPTI